MTTDNIEILIRDQGAPIVIRNFNEIAGAARGTESAIVAVDRAAKALMATFRLFFGIGILNELRKYADGWASASGQIRIATKDLNEAALVQEKLFQVAQKSRQEFNGLISLYTASARAGKTFGASQQDIIQFTENVSKSLAVQHVTATEARGALLQLGQALGSGVVRAQEFNSVMQGTPYILEVVAKNIKGANGNVQQLRQMMLEGKLTSKDFFEAFLKGSKTINEDFGKASITIGQGFTLLNNSIERAVGRFDEMTGSSNALGKSLKATSETIDSIGSNSDKIASGLTTQTEAINTMDVSLGDLGNAFVEVSKPMRDAFSQDILRVFNATLSTTTSVFHTLFDGIIKDLEKVINVFSSEEGGLAGAIKSTAKLFDFLGGSVSGMVIFIKNIKDTVLGVNSDKSFGQDFGRDIAKSMAEGMESQGGFLAAGVDSLFAKAKEEAEKRKSDEDLAKLFAYTAADLTVKGKESPLTTAKDIEERKRLEKSLESLVSKIAPAQGALLEMKRAEELLNQAQSKGLINLDQKNKYLEALKLHYEDIKEPIGKFTRAIEEENKLLNFSVRDREIQKRLDKFQLQQKEKGLDIGQKELAQLKDKLKTQQQLQELDQAKQSLISGSSGEQRRQLSIQQQALGAASKDLSPQDIVKIQTDLAKARVDLGDATWADGVTAALSKITDGFKNVGASISDIAGTSLKSLSDGFADSMGRAIVYGDNLQESLKGIGKSILSDVISAVIKMGIQWALTKSSMLAVDEATTAAATTTSVAAAGATATAWAPAAATTTLGSFGTNVPLALAGIAAVYALTKGFKTGGYTGEGGVNDVAGVVHGREFVMNAAATAAYRPTLEAMNSGRSGPGSGINIQVHNYGTQVEVQQLSKNDIVIIAKQVVDSHAPKVIASQITNPNSVVSKSLNVLDTNRRN